MKRTGLRSKVLGVWVLSLLMFSFSLALDNIEKSKFLDAAKNNNVEKVLKFINNGIDVNVTDDKNGWSALHYASAEGHDKVVKILLENGADVDIKNFKGQTPLHIAAQRGNVNIVKILLSYGADPEAKDNYSKRPIDYSLDNNRKSLVILLTEELPEDEKIKESLFIAVKNCDLKKTKELLRKIDINIRDNNFRTPLFYAVKRCKPEFVKYLISRGAKVNTYDKDDMSPLLYAIMRRDLAIIKLLIKHGAKLTSDDLRVPSPLLIAINLNEPEIVEMLLKAGANPNEIAVIESFYGVYIVTPLDLAERRKFNKIAKILKQYGAKRYKDFPSQITKELELQLSGNIGYKK
jgi:serine/threonine-protein phosphatase 6 regulatory ankyrin repeat subunit B